MRIYVVSLESVQTVGPTVYGNDTVNQQKDYSVQKGFTSREEAERYIREKIAGVEKMCHDRPGIHGRFSRNGEHSCSWVNTYAIDSISSLRQDIITEYSITELDI